VLVDAGRIVGVEPVGFSAPAGVRVHDFGEASLLPGLVDTHAHLVCDGRDQAVERVAGLGEQNLNRIVREALAAQLAAGVTTVRDLGDRNFCVIDRRDRRSGPGVLEPTIVGSGPPLTSVGGHCHGFGGQVDGRADIEAAIAERAERGVNIVKVMASGGVNTPGTDMERPQFLLEDLQLIVDRAHAGGLAVTAHAHALSAVEQALRVGVDGVEHCTCLTAAGFGGTDELLDRIAATGIPVAPTIGWDPGVTLTAPPHLRARLAARGWTMADVARHREAWLRRVIRSGVRLVCGADSGITAAKPHGILPRGVGQHVQLGLSIPLALAGATAFAADTCGLADRKGRLKAGHDADLLVVAGDLTRDVTALLRPVHVVLAGHRVPPGPPAHPDPAPDPPPTGPPPTGLRTGSPTDTRRPRSSAETAAGCRSPDTATARGSHDREV
jgi:imidazolonepropionase-like amidohydrolase